MVKICTFCIVRSVLRIPIADDCPLACKSNMLPLCFWFLVLFDNTKGHLSPQTFYRDPRKFSSFEIITTVCLYCPSLLSTPLLDLHQSNILTAINRSKNPPAHYKTGRLIFDTYFLYLITYYLYLVPLKPCLYLNYCTLSYILTHKPLSLYNTWLCC